jgi:hypothetical protein
METTEEQIHSRRFYESNTSHQLHVYRMILGYAYYIDINGYTFKQWIKENSKPLSRSSFEEWVNLYTQSFYAEIKEEEGIDQTKRAGT